MNEEKKIDKTSKQKRKEFLYSLSSSDRLNLLNSEKALKSLQTQESERIYFQGTPLIFDLSFCLKMTESEKNSMINQIRLSIGYLKKHTQQYFKLICSNVPQDLINRFLMKGSASWKLDLYSEDFNKIPCLIGKKFVMLSPDADEVLKEVDLENTVYIVGGIVDKTVKSLETFEKANELGIECVRLPIKEEIFDEVDRFRVKKVLNINTVVEVLHWKAHGLNWKEALLESIPKRWLKK